MSLSLSRTTIDVAKYYAPANAIVVVVKPENTDASEEEDEPEN